MSNEKAPLVGREDPVCSHALKLPVFNLLRGTSAHLDLPSRTMPPRVVLKRCDQAQGMPDPVFCHPDAGKRVVLASASPRRAEILKLYGLAPEIVPSTFPETLSHADFDDLTQYPVATGTEKVKRSPNAPRSLQGPGRLTRSEHRQSRCMKSWSGRIQRIRQIL